MLGGCRREGALSRPVDGYTWGVVEEQEAKAAGFQLKRRQFVLLYVLSIAGGTNDRNMQYFLTINLHVSMTLARDLLLLNKPYCYASWPRYEDNE